MGRTGELIWQLNGKTSDFTIEPRARFAREYAHPGGVLSTSQGNVHQFGDGGVLAGWGSQPHFSEHAPNGALRSAGRLPSGRCATRESHVQAIARDSRGAQLGASALTPVSHSGRTVHAQLTTSLRANRYQATPRNTVA